MAAVAASTDMDLEFSTVSLSGGSNALKVDMMPECRLNARFFSQC